MSIFDHMGYSAGDFAKSTAFYDAALGALGIKRLAEYEYPGGQIVGYGTDRPEFWVNSGEAVQPHVHVAFTAKSHAAVDAYYAAAMTNGGRDNGGPGIREQYSPNYYAAFVLDPDGHNIEVVCHDGE